MFLDILESSSLYQNNIMLILYSMQLELMLSILGCFVDYTWQINCEKVFQKFYIIS